jgi:hypothetical protein
MEVLVILAVWAFGWACGLQLAAIQRGTGKKQLPATLVLGIAAVMVLCWA